ncbi:MAG: citramalate synthase, partial [Candidatus Aminicenantales bacterium]
MSKKIAIFDSTLRDGAQAEGISYSVEDKWKIIKALDGLGIDYIEAGNPGSNPKDLEFFNHIEKNKPKKAKIVAFGSTKRCGIQKEEDVGLQALLKAN